MLPQTEPFSDNEHAQPPSPSSSPLNTHRLLERYRLLSQITAAANSSVGLEEMLVSVVSRLKEAQISDRISILLLNQTGQLQVEASTGYEGSQMIWRQIALGTGIIGRAAAEKRPIRVDDVLSAADHIDIDPQGRSELVVPILNRDELIGAINLESTQAHYFDETDQEILAALAVTLGSIIANFKFVLQVRQKALHERQLMEASSHIRRSVDFETILETSAKELAHALGVRKVTIQITARNYKTADDNPDALKQGEKNNP